jgi:hypothetical protein
MIRPLAKVVPLALIDAGSSKRMLPSVICKSVGMVSPAAIDASPRAMTT